MYEGLFDRVKEHFFASRVDDYTEEIRKRNSRNFKCFSAVGFLISVLIMLFSFCISDLMTFKSDFFYLLLYFILLVFVSHLLHRKSDRWIVPIVYIAITPIMLMGIMMGTFLDAEAPSIAIMVLLCVLPQFIVDRPWRILLYIAVSAIVYSVFCFHAKTLDMFLADMVDLFAFSMLSFGVNFYTANERIDNVENYMKLRNKSKLDVLTGIYNRGTGVEMVKRLLAGGNAGAFIIMDIDDFKEVNDKFGHLYGDRALKAVSKEIKKFCTDEDIFFRMGGDEFAIFCPYHMDEKECRARLDRLVNSIKNKEISSSRKISLSISLGCALRGNAGDAERLDFNLLYKESDACLYRAKNKGKGCYSIKVS